MEETKSRAKRIRFSPTTYSPWRYIPFQNLISSLDLLKLKETPIAELFMILRHRPRDLKYTNDGWFDLDEVLDQLEEDGYDFDREEFIKGLSVTSRVELDPPRIRAVHGHSIDVEISFPEKEPPEDLYHGSPSENVDSIMNNGLISKRHHVFLTDKKEVALDVVHRYKKEAALFQIDSVSMSKDGHTFYLSNNDVWLVDEVPAKYIKLLQILKPEK